MATLPTKAGAVTLLDVAKATDPDGRIATVAELLHQSNEILTDMPWYEGNLATGHRGVIRTGLPTPIWRKMYKGVPPSKSLRASVEDTCGSLEDRNEIDKDVCELNGNTAQFRLDEGMATIEGINQTMAEALIYGDASIHPERFNGLAVRYNTINTSTSEVAKNVISAGGSGNCTSVWLVVWGKNTIHGIYPKGSKAGLNHDDLGLIDAFDESNNRYRAYADHWQWKCGLHVKDWRYVVRIANISLADLVAGTGTQATNAATWLPNLMIKAMARIPHKRMGRPAFYASRTVKEMLAIRAADKASNVLAIQPAYNQFGDVGEAFTVYDTVFQGVPIRTVDRILETETALT